MSAYCSSDDVTGLFPASIPWGEGTAPSIAAIDRIIEESSALVDDSLRARYTVPFDPVPPLVRRIVRDLSIAEVRDALYGVADRQDQQADLKRKGAMDLLKALSGGSLELGQQGAPGAPSALTPGAPSASLPDEPIFRRRDRW